MECVGGNRFALVLLATKRSRQLMAGAIPRVNAVKNKPAVLALREIADTKVKFDRPLREALAGRFDVKPEKPTMLRPVQNR
jgi:DNA-directed RNA polymerase subunit omega